MAQVLLFRSELFSDQMQIKHHGLDRNTSKHFMFVCMPYKTSSPSRYISQTVRCVRMKIIMRKYRDQILEGNTKQCKCNVVYRSIYSQTIGCIMLNLFRSAQPSTYHLLRLLKKNNTFFCYKFSSVKITVYYKKKIIQILILYKNINSL